MKIIAAVDEKWGIGKGMNLLFRISEDMEFFKEKTMGKTVVMGRKTLESFPNAKPLKNRKNVVLTTDKNFKCDGTEIVHDIKTIIGKYGRPAPDNAHCATFQCPYTAARSRRT